jgi:hypothetical protein
MKLEAGNTDARKRWKPTFFSLSYLTFYLPAFVKEFYLNP